MRGEFFDYDPLTGMQENYEETSDGRIHIHTYQDVQPAIDAAQRIRNEGTADDCWKEKGCTTYAILPMVIAGHMFSRGINFMDPNDLPKVVSEVNTTYSAFKTTDKHHSLKAK